MLGFVAVLALQASGDLAVSVLEAETEDRGALVTRVTFEVANHGRKPLRAANVICALTYDGSVIETGLGQVWELSAGGRASERVLIRHSDQADGVSCRLDAVVWAD